MTREEIMNVVKPAVCAQLKSPASAQFPMELLTILGNDMQGYNIQGFVDSQNSYGAMIRNDFNADVKIQNGYPVVTRVTVAAKANQQRSKEFASNYAASLIFTLIISAILYFIISKSVGL